MAKADGLQLTAEAALIRAKRENAVPRMSMKEAARRARALWGTEGWSEPAWRWYESGRAGVIPPGRLACMALVVDLLPEELEQAGRDDAAAVLRDLMRREAQRPEVPEALREAAAQAADGGLDTLLAEIVQALADIAVSRQLTGRQKEDLRRELLSGLIRDAEERRGHVRAILKITSERG